MTDKKIIVHEPPHQTKTTKILNYIALVSLIVVAVAIGILLKWSFQSTEVLQVKNAPFPTRVVHQEDDKDNVVILTIDYCKVQAVTGTLRISYVSSSREVFLPISTERGPKGCTGKQDFPVLLPSDMAPDTYKIKFRAAYDINPLKKNVVSEFESRPFNIGGTPLNVE